jgi:hypothetical protein
MSTICYENNAVHLSLGFASMGKGRRKGKQRARETSINPPPSSSSPPIRVIGLLADDTVIRTVNVPDKSSTLGDVVSTIGVDLQGHVNTVFGLSNNPVALDIDNVTIPGVFIACL